MSRPPQRAQSCAPRKLARCKRCASARNNVFESLLEAVKYNSLGQISHSLFEVGGEYRRSSETRRPADGRFGRPRRGLW